MDISTSPLVGMAGEAERPTRWWAAWLVGLAIIFVGLTVGDSVGLAVLGHPADDDPLYQCAELFMFGCCVALLFLWLRFKERRSFTSVGLRGPNPIGKLALGLVIGAAMMAVGVVILWALGQYELGASDHAKLGTGALVALVPLLGVFLLQGSTEELLTRGYMLQVGGRQLSGPAAIAGTSVLFSLLHLDPHPVPLINIALYAVFACFIALGDGSLWLICGIHAGWNFFQGNVFGLPVSGNPEATSLWDFGPASGANKLVGGGDFGVEASLVGTAVLLVAVAVAARFYFHREAQRRTATEHRGTPATPSP